MIPSSPLVGRHFIAKAPFLLAGLIQGLLVHMLGVGLPISFSIWRYGR
jgi:hypothetical protein